MESRDDFSRLCERPWPKLDRRDDYRLGFWKAHRLKKTGHGSDRGPRRMVPMSKINGERTRIQKNDVVYVELGRLYWVYGYVGKTAEYA
jgi:hypothetical protein